MFPKIKLATVIAVAVSTLGVTGSAEAHFGRGRGGGIGLVPRARQGNNNRSNAAVPRATTPAPKTPVAPAPAPVVQKSSPTGGTFVNPPTTTASTKASTKPSTVQTPSKVPSAVPAIASGAKIAPAAEPPPKTTDDVVATDVDGAVDTPLDQPTTFSPETKVILKAAGASASAEAEVASPVETKPAETKKMPALAKVPVGATVTLNSKELSEKEGQVILQIGEIALPATIKQWKNDAVVCTLPIVGLTKPSKATLHLLNADGQTVSTLTVELVTTLPTSSDALPSSLDASPLER